jgi:hypothetical protein
MSTLFHIGPQKTATTWIYRCLSEHPDVCTPESDSVHYYDMFYAKGESWYHSHYQHCRNEQFKFDPTYTHIRSPFAPRRIAKDYPNAKIALTLRNPIERAFSHYWHEKKKGAIRFEFKEVLENYDLFVNWIEPGFYAEHIERYRQYFAESQILAQRFELLGDDPKRFLTELCDFYGISSNFEPSWLYKKSNAARPRQNILGKFEQKATNAQQKLPSNTQRYVEPVLDLIKSWNAKNNYERITDVDTDTLKALHEICLPEVERLETLLNLDLTDWKNYG